MTGKIVRSRPSDANALTSIAFAAKKHWGYSPAQIEKWKSELTIAPEEIEDEIIFHMEMDGEIVGFYEISKAVEWFDIEHMWVLPEHIGKGLGKQLFEHAKNSAMRNGARGLRVESDPHAEGFYMKMGMKRVGEIESSIPGRMLPILEKGF